MTPELGGKNYLQRINSECVHYFHDHGTFPDLFEASSNYYKARDGINEGHWRGERLYSYFKKCCQGERRILIVERRLHD